ncbi:MAG: hypothetical protein QOF65_1465 [Thermoleophilaceae bacterium]|jgi:hypothetical protein|nr:hypothetical protein [Thermoleophilaceae bacterium]MEA2436909.1 hypothetical protein [Thermoleophilaceae bacterium]
MCDAAGGKRSGRPKSQLVPRDLGSILRMNANRARRGDDHTCSGCRRVPLAGELLHELSSHRRVCQLCLAGLPESKRETISSQRVHVSDRPLAVAPRAA